MGAESTRKALIVWGFGKPRGEYLAAHVLQLDGFSLVEPIHPQGGPDGLKDIICLHGKVKCVAACWFPNDSNQTSFAEAEAKFKNDLAGVVKNGAQGFVFVTNKHLTDGERQKLEGLAVGQGCAFCRIYHLETLRALLDSPNGVGVRLLILELEMSKEEQQAFVEETILRYYQLVANQQRLAEELLERQKEMNRVLEERMSASITATINQALAAKASLPVPPGSPTNG